jgi:hypothetical protein
MKLTHTQAYLLGSIAKHSDQYRRALSSLASSVEAGTKYGVRHGVNIDAATKAKYASDVVEELLDQLYEEFADLPSDTIGTFVDLAIKPTERGLRRRFDVDEEF